MDVYTVCVCVRVYRGIWQPNNPSGKLTVLGSNVITSEEPASSNKWTREQQRDMRGRWRENKKICSPPEICASLLSSVVFHPLEKETVKTFQSDLYSTCCLLPQHLSSSTNDRNHNHTTCFLSSRCCHSVSVSLSFSVARNIK